MIIMYMCVYTYIYKYLQYICIANNLYKCLQIFSPTFFCKVVKLLEEET